MSHRQTSRDFADLTRRHDGTRPTPFAQATLAIDTGARVLSVLVDPDWDLARALQRWVGCTLNEVLEPAAAHDLAQACRQREDRIVEASSVIEGRVVPLVLAAIVERDGMRLHLRDRRSEAELQAQLTRALTALTLDRREDRGLDGRHRALLDATAEAVAVIDIGSGRVVELTGSAARLLGGKASDLAGAAFTQCFEGRRRSEFIDMLVATALFGGTDPVRAELRHGRGSVKIDPLIHRAGDETILVCRMRRTARGDEARMAHGLAVVAAAARDGIACLDTAGRITHANPAFVAMAGAATPSRLLGRNLGSYLLRGEIDLRALLAADRPVCTVTRLVAADGSRLPVEIAATDLPGGGTGLIVRDISLADVLRGGAASGPGDESAPDSAALVGSVPLRDIVAATTDAVERSCIERALALTGDNRAAAAEMLGLSRQSLYVKLHKFGLLDRGET